MQVVKLEESGTCSALLGMGLSHKATIEVAKNKFLLKDWFDVVYQSVEIYKLRKKMLKRANSLAFKGNGHNEFLKFIHTSFLITAPTYFWNHIGQYSFISDLSTSQMHNALDRYLTQDDFESFIPNIYLELLANKRDEVIVGTLEFQKYINCIPVGFLYTRVIDVNYMSLQNIVRQRENHKLPEWKFFCDNVRKQIEHPEWVFKGEK